MFTFWNNSFSFSYPVFLQYGAIACISKYRSKYACECWFHQRRSINSNSLLKSLKYNSCKQDVFCLLCLLHIPYTILKFYVIKLSHKNVKPPSYFVKLSWNNTIVRPVFLSRMAAMGFCTKQNSVWSTIYLFYQFKKKQKPKKERKLTKTRYLMSTWLTILQISPILLTTIWCSRKYSGSSWSSSFFSSSSVLELFPTVRHLEKKLCYCRVLLKRDDVRVVAEAAAAVWPAVRIHLHPVLLDLHYQPEVRHWWRLALVLIQSGTLALRVAASAIITYVHERTRTHTNRPQIKKTTKHNCIV